MMTLDPGIVDVVRWLQRQGFATTDSGDGVSKPAFARVMDFPHVAMVVDPEVIIEEADRLRDLLRDYFGVVLGGGPDDPRIEATYWPASGTAIILLCNVRNEDLR